MIYKYNFSKNKGILCIVCTVLFFMNAQASERRASTFGYNRTDATEALIAALQSSADTIIVDRQSSAWNIGPINLFDVGNKVVIFESGVVLNAIRGRFSARNAALLRFVRPTNLVISGYGATFRMDREEYLSFDSASEFRHSISIVQGDNVTVRGLILDESGGDGVYIIGGSGRNFSRNILLEDLTVMNHARAGVSVISVEGLVIRNCDFSGARSDIFGGGINCEPNSASDRLTGMLVENCRIFENFEAGIQLSLFHMRSNSVPVDITFKDCHLTNNAFNNPTRSREMVFGVGSSFNDAVTGSLVFEGLEVDNPRGTVVYSRKPSTAFQVTYRDCVFSNLQSTSGSPIVLETPSYSITTPPLGGFIFDNVSISYANQNADPFLLIRGFRTTPSFDDFQGDFTVANPALDSQNAILYRRITEFNNVDVTFSLVNSLPTGDGGSGGNSNNDCVEDLTITTSETSATLRSASNVLRATNLVNHSSGVVRYTAGNRVVFSPGFRATSGSGGRFVSEIGDCVPTSNATTLLSKGIEYRWDPSSQEVNAEDEVVAPVLYPNPIVDRTMVSFLLREDDYVSINIYDIQYQRVKSVQSNVLMTEGQKELELDFSSLPEGLYFVSIEGSNEKQTLKAIKK